MATVAKVRITSVKAQEVDPGTATPYLVTYYIELKDSEGTVFPFWASRVSDGAILDDATFGTWWDDVVTTYQESYADTPKTWDEVKAMLPSAW